MAFDRGRALTGREQKFGTQFVRRRGAHVLWPVDRATTDSERAKWGIGALAGLPALADHGLTIGKAALRRLARLRRARVAAGASADAAVAQIVAHAEPRLAERAAATAAVVGAYWPLPDEVDPRPLARALAARGAALALPVVDGESMTFRRWTGDDAGLVDAGFGTRGPAPDADELLPTILLAPLVAFDATGARLGQGKGYYDRWLAARAAAPRPLCVGVAFAVQQLPAVPTDVHDQHLDAVVTERGWHSPPP
ncbi:MAG: 5-formyltetrahydrofolate cyclo-ligase [Planctomycetes bacterium]|nr:5-formyltetrahydrofolate cyclo-ligase [Planctomycetota bacterium]